MISIRNLEKHFRLATGEILHVIGSLSLTVSHREVVAIMGPSGCGKTTLLRLLAGLDTPTAGSVVVSGLEPLAAQREHLIGYVFQSPVLFAWRTVEENIRLPLEIIKDRNIAGADASASMLALVHLEGFATAYPHELSGGMQSRVALARALVYRPSILLLDEPFGSLDEITRGDMNGELLRILTATAATVVMVTHSIEEAVTLADRVVVLSGKPTQVVSIVAISLARENRLAMARDGDRQFQAYVRELRRTITTCGTGVRTAQSYE